MDQIRIGAVSDKLSVARMDKAIKLLRKKTNCKDIKRVIIHREDIQQCETADSDGCMQDRLLQDIDLLLRELEQGSIDVIPLDMSDYIYYRNKRRSYNQIDVAAYLERTEYGNVLITRRKNMTNMPDAVIETDRAAKKEQLMDIYEGIRCKDAVSGIHAEMGRVKKEECDGILESADSIRLLGLGRIHGLGYRKLEVSRMVPERGQGITALITCRRSHVRKMIGAADHIKSRKELEVENAVYNKIIFHDQGNEYGIEEESFCVCAVIDRARLNIAAYARMAGKGFQFKINGTYTEWEHMVHEITKRINEIVDY